jgi:hypothetical protein
MISSIFSTGILLDGVDLLDAVLKSNLILLEEKLNLSAVFGKVYFVQVLKD